MGKSEIRTGLVGAGYIAPWHAEAIAATPGVRVAAVCDASPAAASALAAGLGVPAFGSLDEMIESGGCDAVHILTPPQTHSPLAIQALEAGLHVLVEKPAALNRAEVAQMREASERTGRLLAVGHNFLAVPGYLRLKRLLADGKLGRVSAAEFNWRFPLVPLRSGPYSLWMLREPGNLLLELGPHLYALATDLFGEPEDFHLSLSKPVDLPGGAQRPQSWRILARAGDVDLAFNFSLVETMDDRSATLYGSTANARFDLAADTLSVSGENTSDIIMHPFLRQMSLSWQAARDGVVNAARQTVSFNRKQPYALGFQGMLEVFYSAIRSGASEMDARFSASSAEKVIGAIESTLALMPEPSAPAIPAATRAPKPTVLVIGGTGFIGRDLTRALVKTKRDVRVLSRGRGGPFEDLPENVEMMSASLSDPEGLARAMEGIETVYHLAKSEDKTWVDCLKNDVGVTEAIAEAALQAGVKRFVYTGTIASYDMSDPNVTITEATGFAEDMTDRNLYARSKATCEARLLEMHRDRGLPLVIARPGVVVGRGGPLQHWGIGRWNGAGAVKIWGPGRNILPFVLGTDVADGLVRMAEVEGIEGESFNLVGDHMLSARDYFDAIHEVMGARVLVSSGWLTGFWMMDFVKSGLKTHVLRRPNVARASLRDWKSRAHFSLFDNARAKEALGWQPEDDVEAFLRKAITEANLFGF